MVDAQVSINLFDAVVFGILFLSALVSLFRGFIREVLSLIAWAGAALITLHLVERVTEWMLPHIGSEKVALIFATMCTYFGALIVISIFNGLLLRYVKQGADVGVGDNFLGLFFGVAKGWLVITLGFMLFSLVVKKEGYPDVVRSAYTLPAVEGSAEIVKNILPEYMRDIFQIDLENEVQIPDINTDNITDEINNIGESINDAVNENKPADIEELEKLFEKSGEDF